MILQEMKKLMKNYMLKSVWAPNHLILLRNRFLLYHGKEQDQVRKFLIVLNLNRYYIADNNHFRCDA